MNPITEFAGEWTFMPMQVLGDLDLTPAAKLVYCAIASHARIADGRPVAWPSRTTLARLAGVSERAVDGGLKALQAYGYVEIARRLKSGGKSDTNHYRLRKIVTRGAESAGYGAKSAPGVGQNLRTEADVYEADKDRAQPTAHERSQVIMTQPAQVTRELDDGGSEGPPDALTPQVGLRRTQKKKTSQLTMSEGKSLYDAWVASLVPLGVPAPGTKSPASLVLASKCYRALDPRPDIEALFLSLAAEVEHGAHMRWEGLFLEARIPGRKLAACLAGNQTSWRKEETPKLRRVSGERW